MHGVSEELFPSTILVRSTIWVKDEKITNPLAIPGSHCDVSRSVRRDCSDIDSIADPILVQRQVALSYILHLRTQIRADENEFGIGRHRHDRRLASYQCRKDHRFE